MSSASVLQKAAGSVKWSALMEVVSRTAQPLVFVVLARLLSPEDYGVVATASIAITFSAMFWDAGFGKALIQIKDSVAEAADVVFWTNISLGILLYVSLFASAPWIAEFFKSPSSGPILRVLGLQILLSSVTSVQQALFVRQFDFRKLFWVRLFTAFAPGLVSIPLAFFGHGPWALVGGTLVGQTVNVFLLWKMSPWRPRFQYDRQLARRLFSFGFWVVLESFAAWLLLWGDSLIVGRYLGTHDLGVYRTGCMVSTLVFGMLYSPLRPVLFPAFSRLQDDPAGMCNAFHKVNRIVIALAVPMGIGLLLVGPEIAQALFGNKWLGLGLVIGIIGIKDGISMTISTNAELYRAMGRPDLNSKLLFLFCLLYLPCYLIAARYGLETFTYARLGIALPTIPIHIYVCTRMLGVSPLYLWQQGKTHLMAGAVMVLAVLAAKHGIGMLHLGRWVPLFVIVSAGAASYAAALWIVDREFILNTKRLVTRAASL